MQLVWLPDRATDRDHPPAAEPGLLSTAIRRGLESTSPVARLGYLELGARLQKEIGTR